MLIASKEMNYSGGWSRSTHTATQSGFSPVCPVCTLAPPLWHRVCVAGGSPDPTAVPQVQCSKDREGGLAGSVPRVPNTARPRPHRQLPATLRDGITREGPGHSLGMFLVSSSAALSSHADVSRQGWFQALPHHEHTALSAAKQPQPSGVGGRATSCPFPQLPPGPRCPPQPAASPLQRRMPGGTRHHKLCSQHQPAYPGEMTSRKFVTPASHLFNGGNVYTEDCGLID